MKIVPVRDAVGMALCHDITQIVPRQFKGPAFRKGHILCEEDIPRLLDMGKEHLYVLEIRPDLIHEDEAARRIACAASGPGLVLTEPREGKVSLVAEYDGLLKIDVDALYRVNEVERAVFATLHTNQRVEAGKVVAGTRIIPLVIEAADIEHIEAVCRENPPLIQVVSLRPRRVGIVTTGSEVFHGRIQDAFGPVVKEKLREYRCEVVGQRFVSDEVSLIVEAVKAFLEEGAEMIVCTGGMSVDPDDVTPAGIRACGGRVVTYGAPVLPGAMFMLAYIGEVPVLGLPGCVMYHRTSIFDLLLPRILAGETLTRRDFVHLAHGGLCVHCSECRYPDCGFGKGV